jgi:hypothetical protein
MPDEEVRAIVYGEGGSAMIGTKTRALVFKRGVRAGVPFSFRLKSFEYESVIAIAVRRTQSGAVLVIHAPMKIAACSSYWVDERDDVWKARNAILVKPPLERFVRFARLVGELVEDHQRLHGRVTSGFAASTVPAGPAAVAGESPVENGLAEESAASERCARCGTEVRAGWRYCPECGAPSGTRVSEAWSWLRRAR